MRPRYLMRFLLLSWLIGVALNCHAAAFQTAGSRDGLYFGASKDEAQQATAWLLRLDGAAATIHLYQPGAMLKMAEVKISPGGELSFKAYDKPAKRPTLTFSGQVTQNAIDGTFQRYPGTDQARSVTVTMRKLDVPNEHRELGGEYGQKLRTDYAETLLLIPDGKRFVGVLSDPEGGSGDGPQAIDVRRLDGNKISFTYGSVYSGQPLNVIGLLSAHRFSFLTEAGKAGRILPKTLHLSTILTGHKAAPARPATRKRA